MVDLRSCNRGDILICKHGVVCEYLEPTPKEDYYDHKVKYLTLDGKTVDYDCIGTRCHDGKVFRKNRKVSDPDVLRVIPVQ